VRREKDVFWRLIYHAPGGEEEWFYVYLHIEHQSQPKWWMALDTTTYRLLAWQDLARSGALGPKEKLPPILTLVFYEGSTAWRAPSSLLDLVEELPGVPEALDLWSYRLIDAQRFPFEEKISPESPLWGLFRLEQLGDLGDLSETARQLATVVGPKDQELAEAFLALINRVVLPKIRPEDAEDWEILELEELPSMIEERIERATERLKMEARAAGLAEGRAEGEAQGEARGRRKGRYEEARRLFLELFEAKFEEPAPPAVRKRVKAAKRKELETWSKRLLKASAPADIFDVRTISQL